MARCRTTFLRWTLDLECSAIGQLFGWRAPASSKTKNW